MGLPTVCVMMSVYNGERFLREQIDSILDQEGVDVFLLVRDDGSDDGTAAILSSYNDVRIRVLRGPNKGIAESFMDVVFAAPTDCEYYAFSDADDVWEPPKLIAGVKALRPLGSTPAVLATRAKLVDEALRFIGMSNPPSSWLGFGHALAQGGIGGATCVLNKPMFDLYSLERPKMFIQYDGWLYMIASALGEIVFSQESWFLYRQHGRNSVGGKPSLQVRWRRRLRLLKSKDDPYKLQARELERIFGDRLKGDKRALLSRFAHHDESVAARFKFLVANPLVFHTTRARLFYLARVAAFRT